MEVLSQPWTVVALVGTLLLSCYVFFGRNAYGKAPGHLKSIGRLPGPMGLPWVGNWPELMLKGLQRSHLTLTEWGQKYGSLYRFSVPGKTIIVVSDPALVPAVLGGPCSTGLPKSSMCEKALGGSKCRNIVSAPHVTDPEWRDARTQLIPAFSSQAIRADFFPVVSAKAHILARKITEMGPDKPLEIQDAFARLALDVILQAGFGIENNALLPTAELDANPLLMKMKMAPGADPLMMSLPLASSEDKKAMQDLNSAWVAVAKQIRNVGTPSKTDFSIAACLARIIDVKTGQQLSDEQLGSQVAGTVTSAVDAIAQTCAWALFALSTEVSTQDKVARELGYAGLLAHGEQREPRGVAFTDLAKLPYLEAVVKETMRMYPVSSGNLIRVADADMELGSYHVPKGTHIQVPLHTMHNVDWNFKQPERFWPERWMEESKWHKPISLNETMQKSLLVGAPKSGGSEGAYMPFGAGPRECLAKGYTVQEDKIAAIGGQDVHRAYPGNAVAFMEVMTVMATLVANFRFRLSDGMGGRRQVLARQATGRSLHIAGGLEMVFVPRATIGFSRNV